MTLWIFLIGVALLLGAGMYLAWPPEADIAAGEHRREPARESVRRAGKA